MLNSRNADNQPTKQPAEYEAKVVFRIVCNIQKTRKKNSPALVFPFF